MIVLYIFSFLLALLVYFMNRSKPLRVKLGLSIGTFVLLSVLATVSIIKAVHDTYQQPDQRPVSTESGK